jgi:hypothetical protein
MMGTKSRESIYGSSIRASAERAKEARKEADRLACVAWSQRMLGYRGPAQPSPALGDALNAGFLYLEVRCLGCDTHQTVAAEYRPPAEDNPDPRAGTLHALQGLLAGARLSVQAQPSSGAAADQDFRRRPSVNMVGGRAVIPGAKEPKHAGRNV